MKKYLIILLAALLLVCAVSCSSSPKKTGIQLDTSKIKGLEFPGATEAKLVSMVAKDDPIGKPFATVSIKDIKSGSVFVELKEGTYEKVVLQISDLLCPVLVNTKVIAGDTIKVVKGEVTECTVIKMVD